MSLTEVEALREKLRDLDERFDREMRARGFDPAQANNVPLSSALAAVYAERENIRAQIAERSNANYPGRGSMTEIERILDQLKRAFEGPAWYGPSVREVLAGVTAEQAVSRPLPGAHTIWELIHHIAVWEDVGRRRLEGDPAPIDISSPEDWPPADPASEAAWEEAKASLDRGHQRLCNAIARVDQSRLNDPILEGMSTVYVTLHGIVQHDLYHAGQIAILKKVFSS